MKIVIGNQTFNSKEVPVAFVMDERERSAFFMTPVKPEGEKHVIAFFPGDIPPHILTAWLTENVPEYTKKILAVKPVGKLEEGA